MWFSGTDWSRESPGCSADSGLLLCWRVGVGHCDSPSACRFNGSPRCLLYM